MNIQKQLRRGRFKFLLYTSLNILGVLVISESCVNENMSALNMKTAITNPIKQGGKPKDGEECKDEEYKNNDDKNKKNNDDLGRKLSEFGSLMFSNTQKEGPNKDFFNSILAKVLLEEGTNPAGAYLKLAEELTCNFDISKTGVTLPICGNSSYGKSFPERNNNAVFQTKPILLDAENSENLVLKEYGSGYGFSILRLINGLPPAISKKINFIIGDINPKINEYLTKLKDDMIIPSNPNVKIDIAANNDITKNGGDKELDVILALNVLHYITPNKWDDVFNNLNSSLKKNGKAVLAVDYPFSGDSKLDPTRTVYDAQAQMKVEWPGLRIEVTLSDKETGKNKYVKLSYYKFFDKIKHNLGDYLYDKDFLSVSEYISKSLPDLNCTKAFIPALCFTKKNLLEKLEKYSKTFKVNYIEAVDLKGKVTNSEDFAVSLNVILEKI